MCDYRRGQVYLANLEKNGSIQGGKRPVVIIQNNMGNKYSPTIIVCTLTTKTGKRNMPTHVTVTEGVKITSDVQTEQILTINKTQLSDFCLCELTNTAMKKIDKALLISLGIEQKESKSAVIKLAEIIKNKKCSVSAMEKILFDLVDDLDVQIS